MAPSLGSLPPEMLNQIITHIHENGHLFNLALCCRSFHDLVIPHLYAHIKLKIHRAPKRGGHYHPGLRTLTSRLMGDPILASKVRSITFPNAWKDDEIRKFEKFHYLADNNSGSDGGRLIRSGRVGSCEQEFAQDQTALTHEIVLNTGDAARTVWRERSVRSTEHKDEDMHIAMLLLVASNLEILDIVSPCLDLDGSLRVFERALYDLPGFAMGEKPSHDIDLSMEEFQRALNRSRGAALDQRPFQHLKIVVCTFNHDQDCMAFVAISLFLRLPCIRDILVQSASSYSYVDDDRFWRSPTSDFGQSTVERLELRHCALGEWEVEAFLCSCTSLKTFVYDFERCVLDYGSDETDLSMPGLEKALSATEATLESLWVDCADVLRGDIARADDCARMSSLSQFKALKNLKIGMFVVFGVHAMDDGFSQNENHLDDSELPVLAHLLPQSLETIYISHTNGRLGILVRALENLLLVKLSCMPRLKSIAFEAFLTGNDQAPTLKKLHDLAVAADVEIRTLDGAMVRSGNCRLDWKFQTPGPLNLGQGWDGSVTWASAFNNDHRLRRFVVDGKHN
ncbi:MAG: hypothetical protein Q9225_005492 [Loekoesia sp. 1 TL-2023]